MTGEVASVSGMDLLGDVVATMRTGVPRSARAQWYAPWGQEFRRGPGSGFVVVLRGPCVLLRPDVPPLPLGVGDVVFLPHGDGYALAEHPDSPLTAPTCGPDGTPVDPPAPAGRPRVLEERFAAPPAGDRTAIPPGATPTTVTLCGAYHLDRAYTHPLLGSLPPVVHVPAQLGGAPGGDDDGARAGLRATVELLGAELGTALPGTGIVVPALLDAMLVYILRTWYAEAAATTSGTVGHPTRGWAAALADPVVRAALDAVHDNPAAPWTVESLGAHAGLSRAAFSRRFTALVGRPPLAYLTWWRLTGAARLLRHSDAPLASVADQVGYASEYAFANAFKRQFGTSPGRYRHSVAA